MERMIRKQIYIQKRQETMLKRLARQRGVSEADLIREAIDRQLEQGTSTLPKSSPEAWERAHQFMLNLHAQGPIPNRSRNWTREDLYEERVIRYARRSH